MELKPIPEPTDNQIKLDCETLTNLVGSYRQFVGRRAAFHVEYPWWQGSFSSAEEEMDFFLAPEWASPEPYEELARDRERLLTESSEHYIRMIDAERERKLYGWAALLLLLPYAVGFYLLYG